MAHTFKKKHSEQQRLTGAFKRYITWKGTGNGIVEYLGADVGFVRSWIENMFIEGMSWDNYGKTWAVDHIVPYRCFDVFNEYELLICWNYRNLMPILNADNLKKQGNVFFAFELLHDKKDKDFIYNELYKRIKPEVEWMVQYIDNYDSKPFE